MLSSSNATSCPASCWVYSHSSTCIDVLIAGGMSLRQLSQTIVNTDCPVGCITGECVSDPILGYRCRQFQSPLLPATADGRCGCRSGQYAIHGELDCTPCDKGFYCQGGTFSIDTATGQLVGPQRIDCGPGLTTAGRRATSLRFCGKACCLLLLLVGIPVHPERSARAQQNHLLLGVLQTAG